MSWFDLAWFGMAVMSNNKPLSVAGLGNVEAYFTHSLSDFPWHWLALAGTAIVQLPSAQLYHGTARWSAGRSIGRTFHSQSAI